MAKNKIEIIEGRNFRDQNTAGSMGVVINTRYVRCYWPRLEKPTAIFADGSAGLEVAGPPTPRNVVFPDDTVFLPVQVNDAKQGEPPRWRDTELLTRSDCFFTESKEISLVSEDQIVKKVVEVEPGLQKEIEYAKAALVSKEVDVVLELTVEEAREYINQKGVK